VNGFTLYFYRFFNWIGLFSAVEAAMDRVLR
jgi:hypothetical protein